MRFAAGAAALVLVVAVALAFISEAGEDPGSRDAAVPTSPPAQGANATPRTPPGTATPPADPDVRGDAGTLVMWSRGELSASVAQAAGELAHVEAAAFVRSETVGLTGSRDADGRPVDDPADGWRIPVDVVAVDPSGFAATLPEGRSREQVAALRPGQVLLPGSGARLRRLGVGARIDVEDVTDLEVLAVVPDGTVRNAEIVLHAADAEAVGLEPDGSVVLRHTAPDEAAIETLREELRTLAPGDRPARVVDLAGGGSRHRAPLVLSLLEVKSRFGEFAFRPAGGRDITVAPDWVDGNIVAAEVPILGTVRCHRGIVEDLRGALAEVVDAGLAGSIDPGAYGGCYHPRLIAAGRDRLSRHSWGIAIDINVDLSQPGLGPPPPPEIVEIFGRHGFRWGGDFLSPDNHHFEWIGEEAVDRPER